METQPITTFSEFREAIPNLVAHRVGGEVFPFTVPETDLRQVMEEARTHPKARIGQGERADRFSATLKTPEVDFQSLPLEEAIKAPIHITVFQLGSMREKGGALAEVIEQIYLPVTNLWKEQGTVVAESSPNPVPQRTELLNQLPLRSDGCTRRATFRKKMLPQPERAAEVVSARTTGGGWGGDKAN